jgi:RNA polymerase sigma-70 factor (ECF subfamily)
MSNRSRAPLSLVTSPARRNVSDAELATALIAGDDWAITETWHRFAPMVVMMAQRALGSRSEAEDLTQDVFHRVFVKASKLRDADSLRSFIYTFAVHTLKSELRSRRVRSWLSFHQPETLVDLGSGTLDVESRDLLRRFHRLLERLSARDRLVFLLRRTESMTVEEIATVMNISTSTVKRSMAHASRQLSRWIRVEPELVALVARSTSGEFP